MGGSAVLELICYLLAVIFAALAVFGSAAHPRINQLSLLSAAFLVFVIPALVHAAEAM